MFSQYLQMLGKQYRIYKYKILGRKPWTAGYSDFKWQQISKAINDKQLLKKFKKLNQLPLKFGYGIDERIVEYSWLVFNLPMEEGLLLDAGSGLNYQEILNNKQLANKQISIVNLNPEGKCFWEKGISYIFNDLRQLPFKNNYFDFVTCISTLEHIGMDNTMIYTKNKKFKEKKLVDYLKVVLELKRVLKPRGLLLITVPYGHWEDLRFMQQFNEKMVDRLIKIFKPKRKELTFYKYSQTGWQISSRKECNKEKYFNIHTAKSYDSDLAAAARAVCCLKLIK